MQALFLCLIVASNMLGSNPFELVALAAYRATRDYPDAFGRIDDWDAHYGYSSDNRSEARTRNVADALEKRT